MLRCHGNGTVTNLRLKTGRLTPKPPFSFSTTQKIFIYTSLWNTLEGQTKVPPKPELNVWFLDLAHGLKELDGFKQQSVTPARFADRGIPGHGLGKRSQTESECWKTETEIGTPTRVEAETWKFARQRGSSRALGTRGLYVLWNDCAANSHDLTRLHVHWQFSEALFTKVEQIEVMRAWVRG